MTDRILDSLNGIKKASPGPWFYSRLRARMENLQTGNQKVARPLWARPVFVLAGLVLVLLVNALILVNQGDSSGSIVSQNEVALSESEDLYTSNNSFDIESFVQQ